jgi:hypothetical protein
VGWGLRKKGVQGGENLRGRGTVDTAGLSGDAPPKAVFPRPLWCSSPLEKTKIKKLVQMGREFKSKPTKTKK